MVPCVQEIESNGKLYVDLNQLPLSQPELTGKKSSSCLKTIVSNDAGRLKVKPVVGGTNVLI